MLIERDSNVQGALLGDTYLGANIVTIIAFFLLVAAFFSIIYIFLKVRSILEKKDNERLRNLISGEKRVLVNITLQLLASKSHEKKMLDDILKMIEENDISNLERYEFGEEEDRSS